MTVREEYEGDRLADAQEPAVLDGATMPLDSSSLQTILRLTRADGSPVFGSPGRSSGRLKFLDETAARLGDPGLAGVVSRWLPAGQASRLPPSPLPVPWDSTPDGVLAILRGDWSSRSDLLAIDHRQTGTTSLVEVGSRGQVWLGPTWSTTFPEGRVSRPRTTRWTNQSSAQSIEWSFSVGPTRVSRALTLFRGRSMALLEQQVEGPTPLNEVRLSLANGIDARFEPDSRMVVMRSGPGKPAARLLPLGLPYPDRPVETGSIAVEQREVVIRQNATGRRSWLPILICWDGIPTLWRPLTVAFRSRIVGDQTAVAVRVAWRPHDPGLVVYRSLGPPALRSFLGHQTSARSMAGLLSKSGEITPILKLDR